MNEIYVYSHGELICFEVTRSVEIAAGFLLPAKKISPHIIMQIPSDNAGVDDGFDVLDYSYAHANASGGDVFTRGERNLWCAVISQAFADLEDKNESAEAERWLLRGKQDFLLVCSLAGISPVMVRMAALERCALTASRPS